MDSKDAQALRKAIEMFRQGRGRDDVIAFIKSQTKNTMAQMAIEYLYEVFESSVFDVEVPHADGSEYSKDELIALLCDDPAFLMNILRINETSLTEDFQENHTIRIEVFNEKKKGMIQKADNLSDKLNASLLSPWMLGWSKKNHLYKPIVKKLDRYIFCREKVFSTHDGSFPIDDPPLSGD